MTDPTFTMRQINGLRHIVRTEGGEETVYPAGTEQHAKVMVSLEQTDHERAEAGLPPIVRA